MHTTWYTIQQSGEHTSCLVMQKTTRSQQSGWSWSENIQISSLRLTLSTMGSRGCPPPLILRSF